MNKHNFGMLVAVVAICVLTFVTPAVLYKNASNFTTPESTLSPTNTPRPILTSAPTAQPTLNPTATPSPTHQTTETPSPSPIPTATPAPPPTVTPSPTPTPDKTAFGNMTFNNYPQEINGTDASIWVVEGKLVDLTTLSYLPNQTVRIVNGTDNTIVYTICETDSTGYFKGTFQAPPETLVVELIYGGDTAYEGCSTGQIQVTKVTISF